MSVLVLLLLSACEQREDDAAPIQPLAIEPKEASKLYPQVAVVCGDCHAVPPAASFPREAWRHEVERGFRFYTEAHSRQGVEPPVDDVVAYYEALAPQQLVVKPPRQAGPEAQAPVVFHKRAGDRPEIEPPAVSFMDLLRLPNHSLPRLIVSDMRSGLVGMAALQAGNATLEPLTALNHPSRVALCDLDGDGQKEIVVGELGSFVSEDHRRGAVVWLRWDGAAGQWRQRLLVSGLGRVADVRAGDFDGDGDDDLVVAEFGHLRTGRVLVYENLGIERGLPKLRQHVVDQRHGAIHVPTADLDGDGRLDFIALISQEHEVIEACLNRGDFRFQRQRIFAADDPAYGSSGIELVDLDADGDVDVLYINGDTFGSDYLKPYHGASWLENRGAFPFVEHRLTSMVGVQVASTADLDGDGDLDIVAAGFLPHNLVALPEVADHDSLLWLEQTEPGQFVRHSLEKGRFLHAALAVGDFDGDGDCDIAVGNFQDVEGPHEPWFSIWWNDAK